MAKDGYKPWVTTLFTLLFYLKKIPLANYTFLQKLQFYKFV